MPYRPEFRQIALRRKSLILAAGTELPLGAVSIATYAALERVSGSGQPQEAQHKLYRFSDEDVAWTLGLEKLLANWPFFGLG